jgi:hypothetical protein
MHLVHLLLPLADNAGNPFPADILKGIQTELSQRFGGLTAYTRTPAKGVWTQGGDQQEDDIVVAEVMAQTLDETWWREFRRRLEDILGQEKIVVRAQEMRIL